MHAAPYLAEKQRSSAVDAGDDARPVMALTTEPGRLTPRSIRVLQLSLVMCLVALIAAAYWLHPGVHAEVNRAMAVLVSGDGQAIGDYLHGYGTWAPFASIFLMILQAVAAPVPAIFIAFANGLTFGVFWGGLLTVAGQTIAAVVCFAIARALGRGPVEALASKHGLETADRWFTRWGARGILLLRLLPGISFDVISYAAGLTGIRFASFVGATALGVAPQAFLYAYLIREAPQVAWVFYAVSWILVTLVVLSALIRSRWPVTRTGRRGAATEPCPASPLA
jgi:uncharacterized membrane protein YdjX (TVP38/TMEM64 family)